MCTLSADLVKAVIEVWSEWREGGTPTLAEAAGAVIWYAEHDAYQRTDPDAGGGRVRVWPYDLLTALWLGRRLGTSARRLHPRMDHRRPVGPGFGSLAAPAAIRTAREGAA